MKGKKLYDPRDGSTAYSTNPALVIRDYLTNASYGFAADSAEIDDTSFQTAANVCDESITLAQAVQKAATPATEPSIVPMHHGRP